MYEHEVKLKIKTNYNNRELAGVLDKLFEIPWSQYEDCNWFTTDEIIIVSTKQRFPMNNGISDKDRKS